MRPNLNIKVERATPVCGSKPLAVVPTSLQFVLGPKSCTAQVLTLSVGGKYTYFVSRGLASGLRRNLLSISHLAKNMHVLARFLFH